MLRLGTGVSLYSLKPQALLALQVVEQEFSALPADGEVVVTSANDRGHMLGSYHYEGLAFDIRTQGLATDKKALIARIAARLGPEYDVIFEDEGTPNEHLHVEWDRRRVEAERIASGKALDK
jgi:hypothetical protein